MSGDPDQIITGALREMAGQAAPPRLRIDAAWRAGRRRRLTAIVTSTAGAAAIAVAVPLAVTSGQSAPAGGIPGSGPAISALPGRALPEPIELRQVTEASRPPCRHSFAFPAYGAPQECFHLASTGMTVTRIASAQVIREPGSDYGLRVRLLPGDRHELEKLTAKVAHQAGVRHLLAIVVRGVVYSAPGVAQADSGGTFQIVVDSAAQFRYLEHDLGARGPAIPQSCHASVTNGVAVTQCR